MIFIVHIFGVYMTIVMVSSQQIATTTITITTTTTTTSSSPHSQWCMFTAARSGVQCSVIKYTPVCECVCVWVWGLVKLVFVVKGCQTFFSVVKYSLGGRM